MGGRGVFFPCLHSLLLIHVEHFLQASCLPGTGGPGKDKAGCLSSGKSSGQGPKATMTAQGREAWVVVCRGWAELKGNQGLACRRRWLAGWGWVYWKLGVIQ